MHLLVGLGNPGMRYRGNRHNAGFMAVEAIAEKYRIGPFSSKFESLMADGSIQGERVLLAMPQSFMNESGRAVSAISRFYKLTPQNITVFHDELDLPLGKIRIKRSGGAGGHNGLKSLDAHLGPDYRRVRIGIGHPGGKDLVTPYVLQDFSREERGIIDDVCTLLAAHLPLLLASNEAGFMNKMASMRAP